MAGISVPQYEIFKIGTNKLKYSNWDLQITKEEAMHHPNKNLITKSLGISDDMPADYIQREIKAGDVLIICTDGLSDYISENAIYDCYENNDIKDLTEILISKAKNLGGNDNITAAILER